MVAVAPLYDQRNGKSTRKIEGHFSTCGGHVNQPYGATVALGFHPFPKRKGLVRAIMARKFKANNVFALTKTDLFAGEGRDVEEAKANFCNDYVIDNDTLEKRKEAIDCVIEALADPSTAIIGLYGSSDARKATLLERVSRRINRDNLFDVILMATVTKKSDITGIQEEIACALGLKLEMTCVAERAIRLCERIKEKGKVLVILCDLFRGLDLGNVGIPFGTDHPSTKILLTVTSDSDELLTNHMHAQKNFLV